MASYLRCVENHLVMARERHEREIMTLRDTNLRPLGIEGLGDMSWGTHFCLFYETKEDLLDFFIPFFKAGLEHREFCLCVASEPLIAEEAEWAMRKAFPDFERYLAEGQIEITPHTDWSGLTQKAFECDIIQV